MSDGDELWDCSTAFRNRRPGGSSPCVLARRWSLETACGSSLAPFAAVAEERDRHSPADRVDITRRVAVKVDTRPVRSAVVLGEGPGAPSTSSRATGSAMTRSASTSTGRIVDARVLPCLGSATNALVAEDPRCSFCDLRHFKGRQLVGRPSGPTSARTASGSPTRSSKVSNGPRSRVPISAHSRYPAKTNPRVRPATRPSRLPKEGSARESVAIDGPTVGTWNPLLRETRR